MNLGVVSLVPGSNRFIGAHRVPGTVLTDGDTQMNKAVQQVGVYQIILSRCTPAPLRGQSERRARAGPLRPQEVETAAPRLRGR